MADRIRAFAPGRVNLIGEHTDYNGGLALPFAVQAGVHVDAIERDVSVLRAHALDLGEHDEFPLDAPEPASARGWRAFVRGAVAELSGAGLAPRGAELEISGTVPQGGGLSSSAALAVSLCLALIALPGHRPPGPVELAQLCGRIENRWVGARTGLLDQLALLCARTGHAVLIDFATLQTSGVALQLSGHRLAILDSGERHAHSDSGYNQRREECAEACHRLGVSSLSDARRADAERLPAPLYRRVRHVLSENARVRAAVAAIRTGRVRELGGLLDASHASLRDDYEVSTPAVEDAVEQMRRAGAIGARLTGGGFGGHVLGLFPPDARLPAGAREVRPGPGAGLERPA